MNLLASMAGELLVVWNRQRKSADRRSGPWKRRVWEFWSSVPGACRPVWLLFCEFADTGGWKLRRIGLSIFPVDMFAM